MPDTVEMSRLSPRFRPAISRANSSSSSLSGMEISAPRVSRRKTKAKKTGNIHGAKPLPPTPTLKVPSNLSSRAPSTISSRSSSMVSFSSTYTEDVPPTPIYVPFRKESLLPTPPTAYESTAYRSSASLVPDAWPPRPKPARHAKTEAVLQKPSAVKKGPPESIFSEWKAPRYDELDDDNGEPRIPMPVKILAQKTRERKHIAEQHAADYKMILPQNSIMPRGSALPFNSTLLDANADSDDGEPYYDTFHSLPTPMSPRITDVVDETLLPRPLRMSAAFDSSTSSHFSSSSDEPMALREENPESLKSRAKKAFHSRKSSGEKSAKKRTVPNITTKPSTADERSKVTSMTPSERASIQRGIIDMYDTLTTLYDPLNRYSSPTSSTATPQSKPKIEIPSHSPKINGRGHGSPAVPLTPYPVKAWQIAESPSALSHTDVPQKSDFAKSPTGSTPRKSHFSQSSIDSSSKMSHSSVSSAEGKKTKSLKVPRDEDSEKKKGFMGGKLKKAVGLDNKKSKKKESEKRREDMKKKIVIVRPAT